MEGSVTEGEVMLPPLNLMAGEEEEEEEKSGFQPDQKIQQEREDGDKGGAGLIRNLLSTMATPLGMKTGEAETENPTRDEIVPEKKEDEGGRGIFTNIISNLFPQNDDEKGHKVEVDDEKKKQEKTGEANDNGGGVIENIVSHLPPSIPDDAVPTADEATILINSLVRD